MSTLDIFMPLLSGPVSRQTIEQVLKELYCLKEIEEVNRKLKVDLVDNKAKDLYWYNILSMRVI